MQLLEWIEHTGLATWVRESPSIFAYTLVLSLHAIGLSIVVGISAMVGLRVLGFAKEIPLEPMFKLFPLMYVGFWINAVSGLLLLSANATGMLTMVMFYLKMTFVIAAILTVRLIRRKFVDGTVATEGRKLAFAMLAFWGCAIITGRLTSYPYLVQAWFGV
ncbi:MAG: hypothetical protein ACWGPN_14275 [Gammaproteobacteria bacterium]